MVGRMSRLSLFVVVLLVMATQPRTFAQTRPSESSDRPPALNQSVAGASGAPIRFRSLSYDDGLPQVDVEAIVQDSLGFMWFGTEDGLVRYDGREMVVYRPSPFDTTSLASSWIVALALAKDGNMWVATEGAGVILYDSQTNSFRQPPAGGRVNAKGRTNLWSMAMARDGTLWLGKRDDNLVHYDPSTGEIVDYRHDPADPSSLSDSQVTSLAEGQDGTIWIATEAGGVNRLDRAADGIAHFRRRPNRSTGLPDDDVRSVIVDRAGKVWAGTGRGLAFFDDQLGDFQRVRGEVGSVGITALFEDPSGILWVGTDDGLLRYDRSDGTVNSYRHDPAVTWSIAPGAVHSIYLDRGGVMWIGTQGGVSSFVLSGPIFESVLYRSDDPAGLSDPGVWSFWKDRDGTLWVGTESGLDRFDPETGRATHFLHKPGDPTTLSPGWVVSLFEDSEGTFWVGTRRVGSIPGALHRFDRATGRVVERYVQQAGNPQSLPSDNPWQLFEDSDGDLWVLSGGSGCPSILHRADRTFESFCHDPTNPNSPSYSVAKEMGELPDGALWFATWQGGLNRLDKQSGTWSSYRHNAADTNSLVDDYLVSLYVSPDGLLWLGTYGFGLDRFEPESETFTHFDAASSGLPNDVVYAIEGDDNGHLWMSTNNGLARLDPASGQFRAFGLEHGLQDLEFNAVSSFRAFDGELFFGGINGFNRFYPREISDEAPSSSVVLTNLLVRGEPIRVGGESPLQLALPYAHTLVLDSDQNDVSISFASLEYSSPERTRYRYRLVGYDDDWRNATAERTATYTNLNAGRYTFKVQATNGVGSWDEESAELAITIRPHWARTWWAYGLYVLFSVGLLAFFITAYRDRLIMRHRLDVERIEFAKLQELDETRSRFFANVSHEFRTPLTLTLGPLEDIRAGLYGDISQDMVEQIDLAHRNAQRVLDLINQILDVSRLEAGKMHLHVAPIEIPAFVRAVVSAFKPLAQRKGQVLELETPEQLVQVYADPKLLQEIIGNLISNAVKFTQDGGRVGVRVFHDQEHVCVAVSDSGPGIPAGELEHIFDRFHRAHEGTPWSGLGTGIGLALSRELAELHGGTLSVSSEVGNGSTFTLCLLKGVEHLRRRGSEVLLDGREDAIAGLVSTTGAISDATSSAAGDTHLAASRNGATGEIAAGPPDVLPEANGEDADATTILVVEDNNELRAFIAGHLRGDYRIIEAVDGVAGLREARENVPDLIISDVMMPEMDGFALCRTLKSDPETDFIPLILLTAKAEHDDKIEGLQGRADDYLIKPFRVDELKVRVANMIESRRRLLRRYAANGTEASTRLRIAVPEVASVDEQFLERIRAVISANLADEGFSVSSFADEMGMDRSQLYRRLQDLVGDTPTELITRCRLDRAADLLAANAGNVSEVAYAVGFKSVAHFSRRFKQQFDTTPSAWRAARVGQS